MLIYGGHAARLRGSPFGREDSDIDMFATAAELEALGTAIAAAAPAMKFWIRQVGFPEHRVIQALPREAPADWRLIEVEIVDGALEALVEGLPRSGETPLFGITCGVSDLITDCLIKDTAIVANPNCPPKHALDLAEVGFDFEATPAGYLPFYAAWLDIQRQRYAIP